MAFALFGLQFAGEQGEQTGFAGAIRAHETDAPARMDLQVGYLEERLAGAGEAELLEGDHRRAEGGERREL